MVAVKVRACIVLIFSGGKIQKFHLSKDQFSKHMRMAYFTGSICSFVLSRYEIRVLRVQARLLHI